MKKIGNNLLIGLMVSAFVIVLILVDVKALSNRSNFKSTWSMKPTPLSITKQLSNIKDRLNELEEKVKAHVKGGTEKTNNTDNKLSINAKASAIAPSETKRVNDKNQTGTNNTKPVSNKARSLNDKSFVPNNTRLDTANSNAESGAFADLLIPSAKEAERDSFIKNGLYKLHETLLNLDTANKEAEYPSMSDKNLGLESDRLTKDNITQTMKSQFGDKVVDLTVMPKNNDVQYENSKNDINNLTNSTQDHDGSLKNTAKDEQMSPLFFTFEQKSKSDKIASDQKSLMDTPKKQSTDKPILDTSDRKSAPKQKSNDQALDTQSVDKLMSNNRGENSEKDGSNDMSDKLPIVILRIDEPLKEQESKKTDVVDKEKRGANTSKSNVKKGHTKKHPKSKKHNKTKENTKTSDKNVEHNTKNEKELMTASSSQDAYKDTEKYEKPIDQSRELFGNQQSDDKMTNVDFDGMSRNLPIFELN